MVKKIFKILGSFCLLTIIGIIAVLLVINIETHKYIYDDLNSVPLAKTAMVLGSSVFSNGELSQVLKDRADKAIELYKAAKVRKILVTGDNSTLSYNEVNPVRKYLIQHDVLNEDIFLDHAGFNTYSSMYRARDVFLVNSVIVVSQSFHLPRAVFIAHHLGLKATGYSADKREYSIKNSVRESLANVKAVYDLIFHSRPKYLGDTIPISGDGRNNP